MEQAVSAEKCESDTISVVMLWSQCGSQCEPQHDKVDKAESISGSVWRLLLLRHFFLWSHTEMSELFIARKPMRPSIYG